MGVSALIVGTSDPFFELDSRSTDQVAPNVGVNAPSRIGITDFRHFLEEGEDKHVTVYQIYVEPNLGSARMSEWSTQEKRLSTSKLVVVERRFSEFVNLDTTLRLLLGVTAMTDLEIPSLPPKVYNPLVDQASESFLHTRREALERYLASILEHIDHFGHPQELYLFLGLDPLTGFKQRGQGDAGSGGVGVGGGEEDDSPLGGGLSTGVYDFRSFTTPVKPKGHTESTGESAGV